jgi:hypothetical protein
MTRQFLAVEFKPGGRRYTYANDGEPVAIGDLVKVETRGAIQVVPVAEIVIEEPPFACKPILGLAEPIISSEENEHAR